jgi:hypothetical protein
MFNRMKSLKKSRIHCKFIASFPIPEIEAVFFQIIICALDSKHPKLTKLIRSFFKFERFEIDRFQMLCEWFILCSWLSTCETVILLGFHLLNDRISLLFVYLFVSNVFDLCKVRFRFLVLMLMLILMLIEPILIQKR